MIKNTANYLSVVVPQIFAAPIDVCLALSAQCQHVTIKRSRSSKTTVEYSRQLLKKFLKNGGTNEAKRERVPSQVASAGLESLLSRRLYQPFFLNTRN